MGKGIIVYQSKYGATKKYAEWLREATGFDMAETPKADGRTIEQYDRIILCGGIYASGIAGISFFRKNKRTLEPCRSQTGLYAKCSRNQLRRRIRLPTNRG